MLRPDDDRHESAAGGGRLVPLDVLRALAVVLVLGRHVPRDVTLVGDGAFWRELFRVWQRGGWIGVDLFFVLSGFLVSGLLFREYQRYGTVRPGRFLIRRGLKIYPAFYLMIASTTVYFWHGGFYKPALVCELLFVQNYGPSLWDHTWSLAVEEHFYVLLVMTFLVLVRRAGPSRRPFDGLPRIFATVALTALALRVAQSLAVEYTHRTHLFPTAYRIDGLAFGVLLSYFFHFEPERFHQTCERFRTVLLVGGSALLVPPFVWPLESTPWLYRFGLSLLYVGSGMLLAALVTLRRRWGLPARCLAWLGAYSYSIYLWHLPVRKWSETLSPELSDPQRIALYMTVSLVFGVLMARLVELPVLALRDRLFPSRSAPLTTSGR